VAEVDAEEADPTQYCLAEGPGVALEQLRFRLPYSKMFINKLITLQKLSLWRRSITETKLALSQFLLLTLSARSKTSRYVFYFVFNKISRQLLTYALLKCFQLNWLEEHQDAFFNHKLIYMYYKTYGHMLTYTPIVYVCPKYMRVVATFIASHFKTFLCSDWTFPMLMLHNYDRFLWMWNSLLHFHAPINVNIYLVCCWLLAQYDCHQGWL
jgi:hypothetical protein